MIFQFLNVLSFFLAFLTPIDKKEFLYKKNPTSVDLVVYQPTYNTSAINGLASPILLAIHGGGFVYGEKDGEGALSDREIKELSSRGWTVVSINYRLAPRAFLPDIIEDLRSAYKWVKNKLPEKKISPVDTNLICLFGRSAGGGLALMGGKHLHPRFAAIISFFPYGSNLLDPEFYDPTTPPSHDLVQAVKGIKKDDVSIEYPLPKSNSYRGIIFDLIIKEKKGGWLLASRDPKEDPEIIKHKLKEWSPIDNIDQHYPPTWIGHGTRDSYVSYNQSVKMKERLEKHNRVVVLDSPDGDHGFDKKGSQTIWKNHVLPAFDWAAIQIQNYKD